MATQIWKHRTSGEQFIVDADEAGVVVMAEGPLAQEWVEEYVENVENGEDFWIVDDVEQGEELAGAINDRTDEYRVVYPYISG